MLHKTFEGYSLAETLISLFLLSLLVIVYSNLSALHYAQNTRDILINQLFTDAHSIAVIIEDKNMTQIPMELFTADSPVPLAFLRSNNHTMEMNLMNFENLFSLQLPNNLLLTNHTVICTYSTKLLGGIEFKQFHVYLFAKFNNKLVYGYASFVN